ncbi:MAG: hypothetical protein ACE5IR_17745 [bacterium]
MMKKPLIKKKQLSLNIMTLLFLAAIFGCSAKDNPTASEENNFVYPLKIGNKWEYMRELSVFNFRPDTVGFAPSDTIISSVSTVEIVRTATLPAPVKTYVLYETLTEEGSSASESESFYSNQADGFYYYAYRCAGSVLPKSSVKKRIYFKGRYFSHIREITSFIEDAVSNNCVGLDSIIYEVPPLKSLPYPLEIGAQWLYRSEGNPFKIEKKVVAKDSVTVPAGHFNCYKIQWLFDIDNNGEVDRDIEFFDDICSEGLIRRNILFKDLLLTGESGPEPIGKFDVEDHSQLINIHLN